MFWVSKYLGVLRYFFLLSSLSAAVTFGSKDEKDKIQFKDIKWMYRFQFTSPLTYIGLCVKWLFM